MPPLTTLAGLAVASEASTDFRFQLGRLLLRVGGRLTTSAQGLGEDLKRFLGCRKSTDFRQERASCVSWRSDSIQEPDLLPLTWGTR